MDGNQLSIILLYVCIYVFVAIRIHMQILSNLSPEPPVQCLQAFAQLRLIEKKKMGKNIVCKE